MSCLHLISVLQILTQTHFVTQSKYDLLDFFCPISLSSESRARALLWLFYHYLEAPSHNPFSDDFASEHPGKIPRLETLSDEEMLLENVDPLDEREWGQQMTQQRLVFMANKDKTPEAPGEDAQPEQTKPKTKSKGPGRGVGGGRKKRELKPTPLPGESAIATRTSTPADLSGYPLDADEEMVIDGEYSSPV